MRAICMLFILSASSLATKDLFAHTRLKASGALKPRNQDAGLKTGPCGGVPRTATPARFTAGAKIQIEWEETVNHPGRYEFYFSESGDSTFVHLKTVVDVQDEAIVNGAYHQYSDELVLPNVVCEQCTIQMIQVMTENPSAPRNYYSCADIQLTPSDDANSGSSGDDSDDSSSSENGSNQPASNAASNKPSSNKPSGNNSDDATQDHDCGKH